MRPFTAQQLLLCVNRRFRTISLLYWLTNRTECHWKKTYFVYIFVLENRQKYILKSRDVYVRSQITQVLFFKECIKMKWVFALNWVFKSHFILTSFSETRLLKSFCLSNKLDLRILFVLENMMKYHFLQGWPNPHSFYFFRSLKKKASSLRHTVFICYMNDFMRNILCYFY